MAALENQVAIVTGASSGIGRASALALAAEGARIVAVARRAERLQSLLQEIEARGGQAAAVPGSVADVAVADAAVKTALDRFGRIDILLNDAGTNGLKRNLHNIGVDEWRRVIDVNLNGAFIFVNAVLPTMRQQKRGTIINIVSGAGLRSSDMAGSAYSASKHGLRALTGNINIEERKHGIRGVSIYPGEVATEILQMRPVPLTPEELSQMLQPEDIAAAVVFAASMPQRATVEDIAIRPTVIRIPQ
ncbi:MAG: SDR family oxidoreductase [Chloroflexi bacterium]|nr:SDR family oxidoreductase [Chloroflexota bacterium]